MKIVLQQGEFEKMAASWVYENLVEKEMSSASIVNDSIELEVFGAGDSKEDEPEAPETNFREIRTDARDE